MAKTVKIYDSFSGVGGNWHTVDYDHVNFKPNWVELTTEGIDTRRYYSWGFPDVRRVYVSPIGIAYPGDATPGTGAKKVTIDFKGSSVIMTLVDNVDFNTGWLIITKGEHVIAYSPSIVYHVLVEPS